jgi:hypothetical protein
MATTQPENVSEARNGNVVEEKKASSHDEQNSDVENNGVNQHPPMTFKRFMAIFTLGCLLAAAQIPVYLIGGSVCTISSNPANQKHTLLRILAARALTLGSP